MTLQVSKPKYNISQYFIRSNLIFFSIFLYINILNYSHLHTDRSTFIKINKLYCKKQRL